MSYKHEYLSRFTILRLKIEHQQELSIREYYVA